MIGQMDLFSFCSFEPPSCKVCGSTRLKKDGRYLRTRKQVFECKRCGCKFVFNQSDLKKMRHQSSVIAFCVEVYSRSGVSFRTLSDYLKSHFQIKASHESIREWINKAAHSIIMPDLSGYNIKDWCADETAIKVNGEQFWLWVVFSPEYKVVIAWHVSKTRTEEDAVLLFEKALTATKHRPVTLTTDQLDQYPLALQKVLGRTNTMHIQVQELGQNNPIERFFREVKRRIKWFTTFRARHSTQTFFHMFFYCYHYHKPHKTLDNRTPLKGQKIQEALKKPLKTLQS